MIRPKAHPVISVLSNGIHRELNAVRNMGLLRASLILLYSGMDQLSYLAMPVGQTNASRQDFANWVEKYVKLEGDTEVTGLELYAARCAMLHKYGTLSKLHTDGKVKRQIGLVYGGPRKVYFEPTNQELLLIDINYLIDAFLDGILRFTQDVETADTAYQEAVNERLHTMIDVFEFDED